MSFRKRDFKPKKRANRPRFTRFVGIDGLMSEAMARHGIARQVTAALLVKRARELAQHLVDPRALPDIYVVSFQNNQLSIACKHAAAVRSARAAAIPLKEQLEIDFPTLTITEVHCRIDTNPWKHA